MAIDGGVTMVQLREKNIAEAEHIATGLELQKLLAPRGVPLIMSTTASASPAPSAPLASTLAKMTPILPARAPSSAPRL